MARAYYNEIDDFAAAWLRELIRAGLVADGDVDTRSIVDVKTSDLAGYTQCHFFAGIGVWSYAMRCTGWPDDRPVWTGSCPCQPFSAAGKGEGHADARHLWPTWFGLIRESRPVCIFGEQVANGDGYAWLDLVGSDVEGIGYTIGAVCPTACGVGAPHIRQRLYFVADATHAHGRRGERGEEAGTGTHAERRRGSAGSRADGISVGDTAIERPQGRGLKRSARSGRQRPASERTGEDGCIALADAQHTERRSQHGPLEDERNGRDAGRAQAHGQPGACGPVCELADADKAGPIIQRSEGLPADGGHASLGHHADRCGPVNGFWASAEWLPCIDGKARPVEPGTFPLATGAACRVGRLRGYGNAICAPVAEEFIRAYLLQRGLT